MIKHVDGGCSRRICLEKVKTGETHERFQSKISLVEGRKQGNMRVASNAGISPIMTVSRFF